MWSCEVQTENWESLICYLKMSHLVLVCLTVVVVMVLFLLLLVVAVEGHKL